MRPWTAEDVEKWGAGYIANQMNGFVQNISALRAEIERMTDVLDQSAIECAEEQIRMESVISDMCNESRELRAEVERLRDAKTRSLEPMMFGQVGCQCAKAEELIKVALAGKEKEEK